MIHSISPCIIPKLASLFKSEVVNLMGPLIYYSVAIFSVVDMFNLLFANEDSS